ncbi:sensor histidine kinase [Aneurinibacillus sp. Ricciae_BoGa-3]|uniref:sensor histidine kinase n=1 Tax=Aneurinibacillus sp. Ricciae_BoGa-3 TaxID=3022697 RepID=UPI002340B8EA|nr:sensor histidine kinase [Aneurinibacillus sp. Ricciae_BoGa-3]WCK53165.1 sensor histidine kinase [Aneurinibacillus sp. Ricciae_BoGa-3]
MSYRTLKIITILLPTILIGGFEFIRHKLLIRYLSMEEGNFFITVLIFILSFAFATWMFRMIQQTNEHLAQEQARRAVYEERERLARELHDGIAQTLFFLNIKLKQAQIEDARRAVSTIDNDLRQAIFNLRPLPEGDRTFFARLEKWLGEWSALSGIDVEVQIQQPDYSFTANEEMYLFAIAQEAFSNIRKHASATQAALYFAASQDEWTLSITDNGKGFDTAPIPSQKYGISMMEERARKLGAVFHIGKGKSGGTELVIKQRRGENEK